MMLLAKPAVAVTQLLPFQTTAEVTPVKRTIGQPRAAEAIAFALEVGARGFHLLRRRFARHRAREHRPGGRALLRRDAADAAGLGLRPQLRRARPPTCLPDTDRPGPKTGDSHDVVSGGVAAEDSPRLSRARTTRGDESSPWPR